MTDAQKRQYVSDLYPGHKWKKRVEKMSDDQIVAIYLKHVNDDEMPEEEDPAEQPEVEFPIVDVPVFHAPEFGLGDPRGPHTNEDDFEIY
jgi:hypothetical protein